MKFKAVCFDLGRYAGALLIVALGLALRAGLGSFVGSHGPLLIAVLTAVIPAALWGAGPGIMAMLAGELLGDYFFLEPVHTFGPRGGNQWAFVLTYFGVTGTCLFLIEALRRARFRAEKASGIGEKRGRELESHLREIERLNREAAELHGTRQALRESELRFQAIADTAPMVVWISNPAGQCVWISKAWASYTGRKPEEALQDGWHQDVHPDDRERLRETLQTAHETRQQFETEYRLSPPGQEFRWMLDRGTPRFLSDGSFAGFIGSSVDVTERKRTEEALDDKFEQLRAAQVALCDRNRELEESRAQIEAERARYRELFDSAPVAYIITDRHGIIQQVNNAATTMLSESVEFLTGFPLARLLAKQDRPAFFANIGRLTRQETPSIQNWEATIRPHSRIPFPCSLNANLVTPTDTGAPGLRWILRDITERKQAEERVLRLNGELEARVRQRTAALEAANHELEAFSYSVSHDLRAPLRSINGFTKAAIEDFGATLDPQALRYLQYAHEASLRMSVLIEDLLDLSRVNRGELHCRSVDISALALNVSEHLRRQHPGHPVRLEIQSGLRAWGDEGLLRIVLENLLGNAWKFTGRQPEPLVEVGFKDDAGRRFIYVRDNGAGFDMAHAGRLFGVFQRLHSQEEYPGTGVGLATVKRILVRHGGEIRAEGHPDQGATFAFWLPAAEPRPHKNGKRDALTPDPGAPAVLA